jgi:hypothetical protein
MAEPRAHKAPSREELIRQDTRDLHRLGYAQQLYREMGGFSNFAISFSIISILTGAIQLFGYGDTAWSLSMFDQAALRRAQGERKNAFRTIPQTVRAELVEALIARRSTGSMPCPLPGCRVVDACHRRDALVHEEIRCPKRRSA